MVILDEGWVSIIEELIAMDLEMRSAGFDPTDRALHRVRNALLVRVDSRLEERFASMLEALVSSELERISDSELRLIVEDGDLDDLDARLIRELFDAAVERERRELGPLENDDTGGRFDPGRQQERS